MRPSNKPMKQLINMISVASTGIFLALPAVILYQLSAQANHEVNHVEANETLISQSDGGDDGGKDGNGDSGRGDRGNDRSNSRADSNDNSDDSGDNGPTGQQGDDSDSSDDNGDDGPTGQQGDSSDEGNDTSDAASDSVSDSPTDSGANAGEGDAFEGLRNRNDNRITIDGSDDSDDVNNSKINGF